MDGEKDPRCLILCLRVLGKTQDLFPQASDELAEACFDVTACYFPITFTPPPNDPYGITPEMLSHALRATLTARYASTVCIHPLWPCVPNDQNNTPRPTHHLADIQPNPPHNRPAMAELVLPLLVDKLTSTHVPAKMEALATLQLAPRYVCCICMCVYIHIA